MFNTFVATVTTVVLTVTDIRLEDTLGRVGAITLEVTLLAVNLATRVWFIAGVLTVRRAVTIPALGNTDASALALELLLRVALVGWDGGTTQLVARVLAIRDAVTLVRLVNTLLQVSALELLGRAGNGRAAAFVSVVKAVIVSVTDPRLKL